MSAAAEGSRSSALESPRAVADTDRPARVSLLARALDGHVLPLAALALVALILHGSGLVGGPLAYERDTYLFYYPLTTAFAAVLRAGHLPFWLPTTFAGYPLLADGEVGPLYPLNLLVLPLLPTDLAFAWLRAIHTAIAGWLTYFFLRRLGSGGLGALAAGLVFSLGSFLVGQQQHENMIRSAVWLPGELLCFESAIRARGWRRQQLFVLGGVVLGVACLGLHIQAIGMSIMALGLYALWRVFDPSLPLLRRERPLVLFWGPGLMLAVALGLSAAQWIPLAELGRTSFRGPGLRYDLATTYSLAPINLPSLVFPYLFRGADGVWWSLWSPWETLTYAGVPTLLLATVAVLTTWRRGIAWYFATLAVMGLWIAMSHYAPFNLHELLWRLPGFSSLRAPGRFGFLTVLGLAGLAAFGLDALTAAASRSNGSRRWVQRLPWPRLAFGLVGLATLMGTARLIQRGLALRDSYLADAGWGQQMALLHYLSLRHENPDMEPYQVYEGLLYSLNLTNPKTAFSLVLLVLSAALLLVAVLRLRWSRLAGLGLVTLLAVDLVVFGLDYHPKASLRDISRLPPVGTFLAGLPPGDRVWVEPALSALEPNRLATASVWELWGYSSLESQRHWEYANSVDRQANVLLDLWGGRYYVGQTRHWDVALVDGTAYRPFELLLSGGSDNPTGRETYRVDPFLTSEVRILSALANAVTVPQGETVAEIILTGENGEQATIPLRAGIETSEHAIDRPDVRPLAAHERAFVGATRQDSTPSGLAFNSNIYEARSTITAPFRVRDISVRVVVPDGYLWLWGLGLVSPDGRVRSLFEEDKTKYEQVYRDDYATVYRNLAAYPRAFVVPEALVRPTRQSETAIARMALRPFEPRRQVVLEEGPFDDVPVAATQEPDQGPGALPPPTAVPVVDRSPTRLEMRATGPGVLVLSDAYHRGWRAYVDGREAPVYIANFLGRGVGLPPGEHDIVMVFDPLSWRLGLALSIATGIFCLVVFAWGARLRRRPTNS